MVKVKTDLTGQKIQHLTVLYQTEDVITKNGIHIANWHCVCDCGKEVNRTGTYMRSKRFSGGCGNCSFSLNKKTVNTYEIKSNYVIGYTSKNEKFYFDIDDYEKVKQYSWIFTQLGYVSTNIKHKQVFLHNYIMGKPEKGYVVDHIGHLEDGSPTKYDNRKVNLRIVSIKDNTINRFSSNPNKGLHKIGNKWEARIKNKGKYIYLGLYSTIEEASKVRKEAEEKYFGLYTIEKSIEYYKTIAID